MPFLLQYSSYVEIDAFFSGVTEPDTFCESGSISVDSSSWVLLGESNWSRRVML